MSMPGAPPRISSMRSTRSAGVRFMTLEPASFLEAGRSPLIRILPTAPSKPRAPVPSLTMKPGTRWIMSRAVLGRWAAKNSGWNTSTPRWLASSSGALSVGPVGTGVCAASWPAGTGAVAGFSASLA